MRRLQAAAAAALLLAATGCVPAYVVPEPLYRQVNREVSFSQLRQDAGRYKGASVMLGGAVLSAKITPEGTQIEVLQLPLDDADRPTGAYELSEGRFLLIDPGRRDPATLQQRLLTVVGEVIGAEVRKVDEADYDCPYLSARFIHVWRGARDYPSDVTCPCYPYPYYYPYAYPYRAYYPYCWDPLYGSASFYCHEHHDSPDSDHGRSERRFNPPAGAPPPPSYSPPPPPPSHGGGGGGRIFK